VLAVTVLLDALVVRCMLLPATTHELLGPITWRLPRWLDARLPHINIEGSATRPLPEPAGIALDGTVGPDEPIPVDEREPTPTKA
jgi:uncharacterized membrane protein YdfJ with MMPL/SSD domain